MILLAREPFISHCPSAGLVAAGVLSLRDGSGAGSGALGEADAVGGLGVGHQAGVAGGSVQGVVEPRRVAQSHQR